MSVPIPPGWQPARLTPIERPIGLSFFRFILTCGFYGPYWIYRIHDEHPKRPRDPSGAQALLHLFLPLCVAIPLLIACGARPDDAKKAGMLPIWWVAMLLTKYSNLAYAYIGWLLNNRFGEIWHYRGATDGGMMKEGALGLVIAVVLWVCRNLAEGMHESGMSVPAFVLHSYAQSLLGGISVGLAFGWWYGIQKSANLFIELGDRRMSPD